jgi:hypothetical protein
VRGDHTTHPGGTRLKGTSIIPPRWVGIWLLWGVGMDTSAPCPPAEGTHVGGYPATIGTTRIIILDSEGIPLDNPNGWYVVPRGCPTCHFGSHLPFWQSPAILAVKAPSARPPVLEPRPPVRPSWSHVRPSARPGATSARQ